MAIMRENCFKTLSKKWSVLVLLVFTVCHSVSAYKHVIFMHGLFGSASEFTEMQQWLKKAHPNTTTTVITAYKRLGSLEPLWHQVKYIRSQMSDVMRNHSEGVHMVCYSQGGLICRAVLETLPDHNVENFVSLSCPQGGQFGETDFLRKLFPQYVRDSFYLLCYTKYGQDFSIGNYWNDPHQQALYRKYSDFLAILNNDTYNVQSYEYRTSFIRLKNLVLIGGPDDGVIAPWQSSQFGSFNEKLEVVPMTQQPTWYLQDSFGLQTLHKKGAVHNFTMPGVSHFDWHKKEEIFQKLILKWLT